MTDRRDFMRAASVAAAAIGAGTAAPGVFSSSSEFAGGSGNGLTRQYFADELDRLFEFSGIESPVRARARLIAIVDRPVDARVEQFELMFEATTAEALSEQIYVMRSPSGRDSLQFVQPLAGQGADRRFSVPFALLR